MNSLMDTVALGAALRFEGKQSRYPVAQSSPCRAAASPAAREKMFAYRLRIVKSLSGVIVVCPTVCGFGLPDSTVRVRIDQA